jgi:hypothetical protein
LITDTRRRARWLSHIISWVLSFKDDLQVLQNNTTPILEALTEIYSSLQQLSLVPQKVKFTPFLLTHTNFSQRTSASILSPSKSVGGVSSGPGTSTAHSSLLTFLTREQLLKSFSEGLIINSLRLLVAISGLLSEEDHENLCGFLWQNCLTQSPDEIQTLVGFIFWSLPLQALIYSHHTGYVFDHAVRGERSDNHVRSNTDRYQKVRLWDLLLCEQLIQILDIARMPLVVSLQGSV